MALERETSGSDQLAVVTGASSGIGEATVRRLAASGLHVLAGVRRADAAERLAAEGIEPVFLDITDPGHLTSIAERVEADGRRLRALVNNAGVSINAPVEALPMDEWRRQFEVNFFGQVAITQALLPALLTAGGRIVNVSSIGGRVAGPTFGAYAGAKFALEGMSDALRREVGRLGVDVIVVEPGAVATSIWDKGLTTAEQLASEMSEAQLARYRDLLEAMREQARTLGREGDDPADVADVIVRAITVRTPRTRYLVGRDARMMGRLVRVVPDRVVDRLIARRLGLQSRRR
jgi:NAD(P)-dependent dehydrogenase (short-subunit alcohol dehydrogenase family)